MKDITGAINAGYTNQELNTALGIEGVDFEGASAAGYSNEDILGGLNLEEKQMSKIWFDDKTTTKPSRITSLLDAAGGSPQTGKDVGITQEQIDSAISPQAAKESVDNALNFVSPGAAAGVAVKRGIGALLRNRKSAIADRGISKLDDLLRTKERTIDANRRRNNVLNGNPKSKVKTGLNSTEKGVNSVFDDVPAPVVDVVKKLSPSTYEAISKYGNALLAGLGNKTASAKIVNKMRIDLGKRGVHSDDIDAIIKHLLSRRPSASTVTKGDAAAGTIGGILGAGSQKDK